ncbi:MAG: FAD-dependent oxidoreductase [Bacillota bacterium]
MERDIVVIGGGPAGLAAALTAAEAGVGRVLIIEREDELGGILNQCIHDGFGLFSLGQRLTGPEYAAVFTRRVRETGIECWLGTMVLDVGSDRSLVVAHPRLGTVTVWAGAVVLAMGCRERTRQQLLIPGTRPAGVYTAGAAQRYVNRDGFLPGRRAVILGSGDIGLIMARRLTLEGAEVEGVYEILPHPSGLTRNVVQCLEDFGIPLHLSHTITEIRGRQRVEAVVVACVDAGRRPIEGSERVIPCDTVILSVGLIPENELSRAAGMVIDPVTGGPVVDQDFQTTVPGIFACGNVVHVHDLVDYVTWAGQRAGRGAVRYRREGAPSQELREVRAGDNVAYVVPQFIRGQPSESLDLYLRVVEPARQVQLVAAAGGKIVARRYEPVVRPPEMILLRLEADALTAASPGASLVVDARLRQETTGERTNHSPESNVWGEDNED